MKKLLVVVDYQNDFVDGALGFEKAAALEEKLAEKANSYLNNGEKVVFTYDTHYENYLETREGRNLPVKHCLDNTKGHELYGKLSEFKGREGTYHIKKESFGISPADMIKLSKELGDDISEIEITGVVTDICVISNAVMFQSQYKNAQLIVNENLCAGFDEKKHKEALDVMQSLQVKIEK